MLKEKLIFWCSIIAVIITSLGVFNIKNRAQSLANQLTYLRDQLKQEQRQTHLLKMELAYLSSPERLKQLSYKYLKLDSANLTQIIADPFTSTSILANSNKAAVQVSFSRATNWRYKNTAARYTAKANYPSRLKVKHLK